MNLSLFDTVMSRPKPVVVVIDDDPPIRRFLRTESGIGYRLKV